MPRPSSNSILNSLKGRIWLAVSALAVMDCVFGLGAYLAVSFFVTDTFITIFVTFFVLAFATMVFGWWLSNEVTRPIESVTLLAKSLERSPSATLPRTTGSIETDELLQTLHRNGQQLQNLIVLMDDAAAGKIDPSKMSIESADRLSASFQKLVSKVTDSISAKRDLDALRSAVAAISSEVAGVRNGRLNVVFRSDLPQTKEISDALRYLTNRLSSLAGHVQTSTADFEKAAADTRAALRSAVDERDERSSAMSRNTIGTSDVARRTEELLRHLRSVLADAKTVADEFHSANADRPDDDRKAADLRNQVSEASRKAKKLRIRSQSLPHLARVALELSKRSKLIALNSSISGNGSDTTASVALVADEVGAFSTRAEHLCKEIQSAGEGFNGEIAELENEFDSLLNVVPGVSDLVSSALRANERYAAGIHRLAELEGRFAALTIEQAAETEHLKGLVAKLTDDGVTTGLIRESEANVQRLSGIVNGLRDSISDLGIAGPEPRTAAFLPAEAVTQPAASDVLAANPLDLGGDS